LHSQRSGRSFNHDVLTLEWTLGHELDHAVCLGKQGVIAANANILARVNWVPR
jgi:hypothetical protein